MSLWKNPKDNSVQDDDNGRTLSLPNWPKGMVQITQAEADAIINPPDTAAQLQAEFCASAQVALDKSDTIMMRCVEDGIAAPVVWNTYRKALRAIASGTDTTSTILPVQPEYPAQI